MMLQHCDEDETISEPMLLDVIYVCLELKHLLPGKSFGVCQGLAASPSLDIQHIAAADDYFGQ